ncbi:hypothetical protein C0995_014820, partial [Termitomyces sp. Mi166
ADLIECDTFAKEMVFYVDVLNLIVVAPSREWPSAVISIRNHIHSCAASNAAIYSTSQEEAATVFCFLVDHDTNPEPNDQA